MLVNKVRTLNATIYSKMIYFMHNGKIKDHCEISIFTVNSRPNRLQIETLMLDLEAKIRECCCTLKSICRSLKQTCYKQHTFHPQFLHVCLYSGSYDPDRKSYENKKSNGKNNPTFPLRKTTQLEEYPL